MYCKIMLLCYAKGCINETSALSNGGECLPTVLHINYQVCITLKRAHCPKCILMLKHIVQPKANSMSGHNSSFRYNDKNDKLKIL